MTNMFKRSLVALAIAGASTGAMAADVTPTDTTYATNEFMSTMDEILSKNVIITLNDEYSENDTIMLRFEGTAYINGAPNQLTIGFGEQFDEPNAAGNGVINPPAGNYNDDGDSDDVNKGFTLDYVAQTTDGTNTVLIYRVSNLIGDQDVNTNDTTYGVAVDFGRFNFDAQTVVAQNGVLFHTFSRLNFQSWPNETNPYPFDEVTSPMIDETQLFKMDDQYELIIDTPYAGELDVWDFRRSFRDPATGSTYGDQVWDSLGRFWVGTTNNPDGGSWDYVVQTDMSVGERIHFTLSGDNMFGWIDSADPQVGAEINFMMNANNCDYVSHTANDLVFHCDDADVPVDLVFDLASGNPDSGQNPKQDGTFSLTAKVNWENEDSHYTGAVEDGVLITSPFYGETDLGPDAAGEWTVNGSVTHIPYMPFSRQTEAGQVVAIDQIIYVTNNLRDPGYDDVLPCGNPDSCNGEGPAPVNPNVDRIIWVEAMAQDGTLYGPFQLEALANPGVTKITGEIREALFNAGALNTNQKFSLTINVADYPTNISVYSAYNVNGSDRGWVQNDSVRTDVDLYKGIGIID